MVFALPGPPAVNANRSQSTNERISVQGDKSGRESVYARQRPGVFLPGYRPSPAAETANAALARAKVTDTKGFFQKPRDLYSLDCFNGTRDASKTALTAYIRISALSGTKPDLSVGTADLQ
jgi:hypothetical protein